MNRTNEFLDMYEGETRSVYKASLRSLARTIYENGSMATLPESTNEYKTVLSSLKDRGYSNNSIKRVYAVARTYSKWLFDMGYTERDCCAAVRQPKRFLQTQQVPDKPKVIPKTDMERLLCFLYRKQTKRHTRAARMIQLAWSCYLRVSELQDLYKNQLSGNLTTSLTLKIVGKGNKIREVCIPKDIACDIYWLWMHEPEVGFFTMGNGKPIHSKRRIQHIITSAFREYSQHCPLDQVEMWLKATPHWLRHSGISQALADGVDLLTIRDQAGHSSLLVTNQYLHRLDK